MRTSVIRYDVPVTFYVTCLTINDDLHINVVIAVSYTHLDVYKRQKLYTTIRKEDREKASPTGRRHIVHF